MNWQRNKVNPKDLVLLSKKREIILIAFLFLSYKLKDDFLR